MANVTLSLGVYGGNQIKCQVTSEKYVCLRTVRLNQTQNRVLTKTTNDLSCEITDFLIVN